MRLDILKRLVWKERALRDPVAKYIMLVMAIEADDSGRLEVSQDCLASMAGYSTTTIRMKTRLLADTGFLKFDFKAGGFATSYQLTFPQPEKQGAATWQTI